MEQLLTKPIEKTARLMIVDDNRGNLDLLEGVLRQAGYHHILAVERARDVVLLCGEFDPDLLLLDLYMPGSDGFMVMNKLKALPAMRHVPIIMITSENDPKVKLQALRLGASDFLTKPFIPAEVQLRVENLLENRFLKCNLEDLVRERTHEVELARLELLERLAHAAEYRDDDTGRHIKRVGTLSAKLAAALGLPDNEVELIRLTAPLHDLGKIAIPDYILRKPATLKGGEYEIIKTHATIGVKLLAGSTSALLQMAERIARYHHEKWDGTGYPNGLAGEAIPLEARIVAVADVFDALSHERPYRGADPEAARVIEEQAGKHFDPRVVAAFKKVVNER